LTASGPRRAALAWTVFGLALSSAILVALALPVETFHGLNPVTHEPLVLRRGHEAYVPFDATWAIAGLRERPLFGLVLAALAALGFGLLTRLPTERTRPLRARAHLAIGLGFGALAWLLPVDHARNEGLGDGLTLPTNVGGGMTFGAEIGTSQLMVAAARLFSLMGSHDALVALRALDAALAVLFAGSLAMLADAGARTVRGRALLMAGLLFVGTSLQLMGYVETTMLELAALALYMGGAAALLTLGRRAPSAGVLSFSGLGLAVIAHGAGPLALPSAAALTFAGGRVQPRRIVHHAALFSCCVVLPFVFVVAPRWLSGDLGNADGGGDHITFVPDAFNWASPPSNMVYYTRFSALHLADLGNALLVGAPIAPLLLIGLPWLGRAARPSEYVVALLVLSLFTFVIPLVWNHDFGMWGDWNLATVYLFPLHTFSWVWLVQSLERLDPGPRWTTMAVGALCTVQALGVVGLALQLY
jgi:hypothetical protein